MLTRYEGNCPGNVAKDAKYGIHSRADGHIVGLTYRTSADERWYVSHEAHQPLVAMVNKVKVEATGTPGGAFYLNEYGQVIVPAGQGAAYYLAGEYHEALRFAFEGKVLSGEPVSLEGEPLKVGDEWLGPRPGIPYKLAAGGRDLTYVRSPRPNVELTVRLSKVVGVEAAERLAARLRSVKGFDGGRVYVNEWRALFTPLKAGSDQWRYVYLGQLEERDAWFPKPHA